MCELCRTCPCDSRCPNAEEDEVVLHCDECKAEIREGDTYYSDNGWNICEKCNSKRRRIARKD